MMEVGIQFYIIANSPQQTKKVRNQPKLVGIKTIGKRTKVLIMIIIRIIIIIKKRTSIYKIRIARISKRKEILASKLMMADGAQ